MAGIVNYKNGLASMGIPVINGVPAGITKCLFVDYGNGSDGVSEKANSANRPWKTLSYAESKLTTNKNEGIALMGSASHVLTEMLDWSKSRCHLFGYDPGGRLFGQNAKVGIGITTETADIAAIKNTGVRNSFANIKFYSDNSLAQAVYTFAEGGEYTVIDLCEFYKSTHLTTAAAAEFLCNGDSLQVFRSTFGDLVNGKGGSAAPRANILFSRETLTGKVARDVYMDRCRFLQKALHADANFMYGSGTTDIERSLEIRDSSFWNAILASATITDAITFGGAQTEGNILLVNPVATNVTAFAEASHNVFVQGAVPTAATTGIAVEVAA
jgi:hypothetical protein